LPIARPPALATAGPRLPRTLPTTPPAPPPAGRTAPPPAANRPRLEPCERRSTQQETHQQPADSGQSSAHESKHEDERQTAERTPAAAHDDTGLLHLATTLRASTLRALARNDCACGATQADAEAMPSCPLGRRASPTADTFEA